VIIVYLSRTNFASNDICFNTYFIPPTQFSSVFFPSKLTTVVNDQSLVCLSRLGSIGFNLLDNVHSFGNLSEDNVLSIEPSSLDSSQEELGPISVGSSISHGQDSWSSMLEGEVLISKLLTIDGLSTSSIVFGEVSSLNHEVGNDPMESGSLESESLLAGTESSEVLSRLGDDITSQFHDNPAEGLSIGGDIKENTWECHTS